MNIGLDIHGVIDRHPEIFFSLSQHWASLGYLIHIITGQSWETAVHKVEKANIVYHYHYSIVDYHKQSKDVKMWSDNKGWWMPDEDWNKSKGNYCKEANIDIHFDDELQYAKYMPDTCTFVLVNKHFSPMENFFYPSI